MVYSVKRKDKIGFPKQDWTEKDVLQNRINSLLYEKKVDEGQELNEPKLLTIIIKKKKEHYFHFLRNETEFKVFGIWSNTSHKVFKEDNAEIQIQYLDNKKGTVSGKLNRLFKAYNKDFVDEEVLYVTTSPINKTSLNLKEGRE
jgi:hypothetical protein